ncbi:hypothetical protein CJ030_MR7G008152 [Morella rubra]|uniref:Uncharacterized protein n=1 Tax=Morella rubra TaxID=262757 RepID=A0A6A1V2J5_9ROSI|nr:hypothetical protein CJ030_MR7G008152 [Morella rubra]
MVVLSLLFNRKPKIQTPSPCSTLTTLSSMAANLNAYLLNQLQDKSFSQPPNDIILISLTPIISKKVPSHLYHHEIHSGILGHQVALQKFILTLVPSIFPGKVWRWEKVQTRIEICVDLVIEKTVEYAVAPVGRWLCYSFRYSNNIQKMEQEEELLQDDKNSLQLHVDAAIRNGEKIYDNINRWLTKVGVETEKVRKKVL